jgi:hypothetical protein
MVQGPPQPYGPPAPVGGGAGKAVGAIVLAIILMIILIASMTLVWWTYSMNMDVSSGGFSVSMEANIDMKLDEGSYDMKVEGLGIEQNQGESLDLTGEEEEVGETTRLLLILGVIMLCILILLLVIMVGTRRNPGMSRNTRTFGNFALIFALLALIFMLIAPVYYMTAWPEAVKNDMEESSQDEGDEVEQMMGEVFDGSFIGSETTDIMGMEVKSSWGPEIGWILAIIGMIMGIVLLILVKLGIDQTIKTVPTQGYGPQQYGMGQPPQYQQPQYPQQPPQYPPPQYPQRPPQYPPQQYPQ